MSDLRDAKKQELAESRQRQWELQNELEENRDATRTLDRKLRQTLEEKQRAHDKREGVAPLARLGHSRHVTLASRISRRKIWQLQRVRLPVAEHN